MKRRDRGSCASGGLYFPHTRVELERATALREAEYNRLSQTRKDEAEREKRHDLRRRALKQRELRGSFRKRRLQNFFRESNLTGTARAQPVPPSVHFEGQKHRDEPEKKAWPFYRKTGFIWSNLGRTPRNRLALVVRPISVKRDRECLERLLWKVEQEEEDARTLARLRLDRITTQRERRLEKTALNKKTLDESMTPPARPRSEGDGRRTAEIGNRHNSTGNPGRLSPTPPTIDQRGRTKRAVLSRRQQELAHPKGTPHRTLPYFILGHADLAGLLCTEPALEGVLDWHVAELGKKLTAARFAKYYCCGGDSTSQRQHLPSKNVKFCQQTERDFHIDRRPGERPTQHRQRQPQTSRERAMDTWPFSSAAVQGVASVEFDARATMGDEASFSTAPP